MNDLLSDVARRAASYIAALPDRPVAPHPESVSRLIELGGSLPESGAPASEVLRLLDEIGSPATVASTGGRYFGFVIGGVLPSALAANWLTGAWDQNVALAVMSPVVAAIEEITAGWLRDIFRLPQDCAVGFVTGDTMANFAGLAAARSALLRRAGWNVEEQGLFSAPELKVVVGEEVHVSVLKALSMLGLGRSRVIVVPADGQGRMRADSLPLLDDRTIVCIQAGNVNTGAFDPAADFCVRARTAGAWVHVDGAFGLWASSAPKRSHLMNGYSEADSWATDCHKWLNTPYDSGIVFVREASHLRDAMTITAGYLPVAGTREPSHYTPEMSRRARAVEIWAALKALGRSGLAEMVERHCRLAARFAAGLSRAGHAVLNDVVLNQVLVSFGSPEKTRNVIAEIQKSGVCWCGGTEWHAQTAMRISVSCWATTEQDVDRSIEAIVRIAR